MRAYFCETQEVVFEEHDSAFAFYGGTCRARDDPPEPAQVLAIIFLFPLLWSLAASVSPQASTGQVNGFGLGNYTTLFNYGAGLVQFLLNSALAVTFA